MTTTTFVNGTVIAAAWLNDVDDVTYNGEVLYARHYGAVGDGTTDDTAALQSAITAANGKTLYLDGLTYKVVKGAGTYVLTVPANIQILGVRGLTTIKLESAAAACHMLGASTTSTTFRMEGVTLDGNKASVSGVNVNGLYLPDAHDVVSQFNTYQNLRDFSGTYVGGHGIYVAHASLCERVLVDGDTFTDIESNAVQTYYVAQITVQNCFGTGALISFTDINGQTLTANTRTKTKISNNVVVCDAAFPTANSVLSLLGNDIECVGNKITGGGTQIVVHDDVAQTRVFRSYVVANNSLWASKANGIVVNQSSATYSNNHNDLVIVSNNNIYQPITNGIACVGSYVGSSTLVGSIVISGNIIDDYLTDSPAPQAFAGIRLQGVCNVTVNANVIKGPRWAGIMAHYDGKNIAITGNTIVDHQGRSTTTAYGGPIVVHAGSATAYLGNISIDSNVIQNYSTVQANTSNIRSGGIVINEAFAVDISVKNNRILTGTTVGIALYNADYVSMEGNEVRGYYSVQLLTQTPGANCILAYAINYPRYATTANRNDTAKFALTGEQIGFSLWDISLTEPIWWNGTVWKNEANATV